MITLQFTVDGVNRLLGLLGQLPFAASNGVIQDIVQQAQPQAEALDAAAKEAAVKAAE